MRGFRSNLALLVVLLGLGGYIYYSSTKPPADTSTEPKLFPGIEGTQIEQLTVKSDKGDVTTLKKDAGVWKLTAPIETTASDIDVSSVANALADIRVARVVEEAPADVKQYGLDAPRIEISFSTADAKTAGKLLVGKATTTGGNLYARKDGEPRVILIGQYHEASLNKSTFDFRDKKIATFDRAAVDGVDVTADSKVTDFTKANGEWTMRKPLTARADLSAVEGIISDIESAEMKSVAATAPTPEELKKFGLDRPQATVNLRAGDNRTTFLVGGKADEMTSYVRYSARPEVFTIDTSTAEAFGKPEADYRKKDLFDFRAFSATRIEVTHDGKTLTLERVKSTAEGTPDSWKRLTPTAGDTEREKVETFLAGLADIRAVEFSDNKNLALPGTLLTVAAKFDEGRKEERVTFGKSGENVYATRSDDPGSARVDAEKFNEAIKTFGELAK